MANSDLKNNVWKLNDRVKKELKLQLSNYKGNKKIDGYNRLINYYKNGQLTYDDLKNVKKLISNNSGIFTTLNLDKFTNWVEESLAQSRKNVDKFKNLKNKVGLDNAFKKTHNKQNIKPKKPKMSKINKSLSSKNVFNNNINYENFKNIQSLIINETHLIIIEATQIGVEPIITNNNNIITIKIPEVGHIIGKATPNDDDTFGDSENLNDMEIVEVKFNPKEYSKQIEAKMLMDMIEYAEEVGVERVVAKKQNNEFDYLLKNLNFVEIDNKMVLDLTN